MGCSMALNIIKTLQPSLNKSSKLFVYDLVQTSVDKLVENGAISAPSIQYIAENCDVIITMVPNTQHVTEIMRNETNGIFARAREGTLIIDCSTIDPITSAALINEANAKGLKMLDAPVSGGVTGAAAGTLTFMCGGDENVLEEAKPILSAMGKNIVFCGGPGSGGVTKLCNNLSLAISMIGTSEAMSLGIKLGMDPNKLAQVMNTSTASCWSSLSYNPVPGVLPNVPSSRGYTGGFGSALMTKDLTLAMDAAKAVKANLPLGANAHQLYNLICSHGYENKDFSAIFEYLNKSQK